MPRNKLTDLNNHLFEQLERLNNDELEGEELETEIKKAEAVTKVASMIIQNGHLALKTMSFMDGAYRPPSAMPKMLELDVRDSDD